MADLDPIALIDLTSAMVAAYVERNAIRPTDLPGLIVSLHAALAGLGQAPTEAVPDAPVPAVSVKKSVTDDYIISLEDGRKFKTMRRYLAGLGMTPEDYRRKWGLPTTYPMVAPAYAAKRSELAKSIGLGQMKSKASPEPDAAEVPAKKRGRPKKAA